jgi:hypothetical protein
MLDHEMKQGPSDAQPAFTLEKRAQGTTLVLTGQWTPEAELVLLSGEADGLEVNYARGSRERDLEFLGQWPIRWMRILARTLRDVEPIYRLGDSLEELHIQTAKGVSVDLARLPHLTSIAADWEQVRRTIESTDSLQELTILRFAEPDLEMISKNSGLVKLVLKEAPYLESLTGLGALRSLIYLGIFSAKTLLDLSETRGATDSLRRFELEACPAVSRLTDICGLAELEFLGFSDCKDIESIASIASLQALEVVHAWGTTRVVNGDLVPLAALPNLTELRMRDRHEYHPRVAEIQAQLTVRQGGHTV